MGLNAFLLAPSFSGLYAPFRLGGIAGDFPIRVMPMLHQNLGRTSVPLGKLGEKIPRYIIESDDTIVAPLVFVIVLEQ